MKRIKMICNPSSGKSFFDQRVDELCIEILNRGYTLNKYITIGFNDAFLEAKDTSRNEYDFIVVVGGDGTVNEVVSGIVTAGNDMPLGIFHTGTINDFANYLKLTNDPKMFCDSLDRFNTEDVDVGVLNGSHFINVVAGGFLTDVAHKTPKQTKKILGRIAYYLEGIKSFTEKGFVSYKLKFEIDDEVIEEDISMFFITNSKSIGGINKMAPLADIQDGFLDCILIKKSNFFEASEIFLQLITGEHINNKNVIYKKGKVINISSLDESDLELDKDGEYAGHLPAKIKVLETAIKIIV